MIERDPLIEQLAGLDPVRFDRAPEPGSIRHAEILERAMQTRITSIERSAPGQSDSPTEGRRPRRRRALFLLSAAAAIVAVLAAVAVFQRDRQLSPAAALGQAAEQTGDAHTLRSEYIRDQGDGTFTVSRSEHRGGDLRRTFSVIEADGTERTVDEGDDFVVYIGDKGWIVGENEPTTVLPEQRNAPYAESSAAIVKAAVTESNATEVGTEQVRDVEATHYRVNLDESVIKRLGQLPPNQLSGFELESPGHIRSLDVWIADGYIRRIRVTQDWEATDSAGTTVEFYDFGADITITPPS